MKRLKILDILKGVCIILIILDHYTFWGNELRLQLLFPYTVTMAVPILMILSGYVYSMSYERHNITTLNAAYHYRFIMDKYIRYTIPFLIAFLLEFAISGYDNGFGFILPDWICGLFTGGWGPGSYYYPLMIQFIFIFPIIYFIIKKYDFAGLLLCGILNIAYEWLQYVYSLSYITYRLLLFRYLLLIAFGGYVFQGKSKPKRWVNILSTMIGMFFIWLYSYQGYQPTIIKHWTETCFLAALFIMPITGFILSSDKIRSISFKPLEIIGKASFNIFLVQMVYFNYVAKFVYQLGYSTVILNIINLTICIVAGIIFYLIESRITKCIISHANALDIKHISIKLNDSINNIFIR